MEWFKFAESIISDGSEAITYRAEGNDDVEVIEKTKTVVSNKKVDESQDWGAVYEIIQEKVKEYAVVNGESITSHATKEEAFAYAEDILNTTNE